MFLMYFSTATPHNRGGYILEKKKGLVGETKALWAKKGGVGKLLPLLILIKI
jgi:hypothetical protein